MAFGLVPGTSMDVLARGVFPILVGFVIVAFSRVRPLPLLLGAFLVAEGFGLLFLSLGFAAEDPLVNDAAQRALHDLLFVGVSLVLAYLALYPEPLAPLRGRRWLAFAPVALALARTLAGLARPDVFLTPDGRQTDVERWLGTLLGVLALLVAILIVARFRALRTLEDREDHGYVLLALWGIDATYWGTHVAMSVLQLAAGEPNTTRFSFPWNSTRHDLENFSAYATAVVDLALPLLVATWHRREDGALRAFDRNVLAIMGGLALLCLAQALIFVTRPEGLGFAIWGIWNAAAALLILYALARSPRMGVELPRRVAIAGTIAACAVVYVCTVDALGVVLGGDGLAGPLTQALSVGAVAIVAYPFWRGGLAVHRASLGHAGTEEERARKLALYRAALEDVLEDTPSSASRSGSDPRTSSATRLARLRSELGLSERDHAVMEAVLRERGDAKRGGDLAALQPGSLFLGRYRIQRELGAGGFGETWLARDERLARDVAIKTIRSSRALDAEGAARFLREMRLLAGIRHPHVVAVYDIEEIGERIFLVMEHAPGGSLRELIAARGALPPPEVERVAGELLSAVGAVHAAGLVHRDVKPSNVLLDARGGALLADFGAAGRLRPADGGATASAAATPTMPAQGTLRYSAPEQVAHAAPGDERADLYAVGATLWELARGKPYLPFEGKSDFETRILIATAEPDASELPDPALAAWLLRLLAKDPASRFPSAADALAALPRAAAAPG